MVAKRAEHPNDMRYLVWTCLFAVALSACVNTTGADGELSSTAIQVAAQDFEVLQGTWSGELKYLNYGTDQRSTIPVGLNVTAIDSRAVDYAIRYPGEEQYNSKERLRLSRDGSRINGAIIVARTVDADGSLVLTTRAGGSDDNRPAEVEMVYIIAPSTFKMRKNIRFDEQDVFFNRNEYRFSR